jgi:hypothetical protein
MNRNRLIDFRLSRGPQSIGLCQADLAGCAQNVNAAMQRLLLARESGDTGWWGTWARMVFNVDRDEPTITLPRDVARLINVDVCRNPVNVQNEFYEFLSFGIGLQDPRSQPGQCRNRSCLLTEVYDRGTFPSFIDLDENRILRAYITDNRDIGERILVQGTDTSDNPIISLDGTQDVLGVFLDATTPFVDSPTMNSLTGIQKGVTAGPVRFYQVDPDTSEQELILTMEPSEQVAAYRRYHLGGLPRNCCDPADDTLTVQVTALAKLEFVPVRVDTDYLLIGNIEALIAECESIRYSSMDNPAAKQMAAERHGQAIRLLQGELIHQLGTEKPAINFAPFGSARLNHQLIGRLT